MELLCVSDAVYFGTIIFGILRSNERTINYSSRYCYR